jgi:hypothetical protein
VPKQYRADATAGMGSRGDQQVHVDLRFADGRDIRRCRAKHERPGWGAVQLGDPQPAPGGPLLHQGNPIGLGRERLGAPLTLAAAGHQPPHRTIQHGKDRRGVMRSTGPDARLRRCTGFGKLGIGHGQR